MRQYADADQARASSKSPSDSLASCTDETYGGAKLTYAPIVCALGRRRLNRRQDTSEGGADLLQFFAVVGPVLANTGGGGLMNANADE